MITYINNETTFNIRNFSREKRAIPKNGAGGGNASIFVCKVIISVCLFVGLSDHKSGTPRPIYLNLWGTRESHGTFLSYEILVIMGEIAKSITYVNARVNGGTNYDYPRQRWVPKLGFYINQSNPTNKFNSSTKFPLLGSQARFLYKPI